MGTHMTGIQLTLSFKRPTALLTPDELYEGAVQPVLEQISEDRRIERKPVGIHAKALGQYFSMWANTAPDGGLIVIGIEDDGTVSGCRSASQKHINDVEKCGDTYCPDARFVHKRVPVSRPDGEEDYLLLIRVFYRNDKVVATVSGEAFTRIGDSKKRLRPEAVRELQICKRQVDLELEPASLKYPQDFDMKLVATFLERVRRDRRLPDHLGDQEVLALRHLGEISRGEFVPNVACLLLFAKDPIAAFPGCKLRFLRFDGEHEGTGEKFNAVKDISIEGPVPILIHEAEKVMESQLREFSRLNSDGRFYTAPEYPKAAWYEAVVNACVHRSYGLKNMMIFVKMFDDRLVVESPGAFPPLVTPDNIYDMHQPRNPYIMDAMFYMDFVKCAHEGTRRMRDTMRELHLPTPEFKQQDVAHALVRVTLRNNAKQRKVWVDSDVSAALGESILRDLADLERRAINFIAEHGSINVSQMQRLTGRTWHFGKKILLGLTKKSILKHVKRPDLDRDPNARFVLKNGE